MLRTEDTGEACDRGELGRGEAWSFIGVEDNCSFGDDCIFGVKGKRFAFEVGDKLSDQTAFAGLVIPFSSRGEIFG